MDDEAMAIAERTASAVEDQSIVVASTTSPQDSGLFGYVQREDRR